MSARRLGLDLSRLPPQRPDVLARLAIDAAPPSERAAVEEALHHRASSQAQGRAAQRQGIAWEAEVFAALDVLVLDGTLATWGHYGPRVAHTRDRAGQLAVRVVGAAPCDVVGATGDGRALVAEVKRGDRVVLLGPAPVRVARLEAHQRAQLEAVHRAGGVAAMLVCVRDRVAVVPWGDAREETELRDVRRWEIDVARGLRALVTGGGR